MGRSESLLLVVGILVAAAAVSSSSASIFSPISDSHRSAALDLFPIPPTDGSFPSLEEAYEALRTFEVLGIDKKEEIKKVTCGSVSEALESSSSSLKDLYYSLKVNRILNCATKDTALEDVISRLQSAVSSASSLLDYYYSVGGLVEIKDQTFKGDLYLADAEGTFHSIKALRQSDGRWRYSSSNPESSTFAAGLALEALAGVVSLSSSEIDQSLIGTTESDILKLFDSIDKYDDDSFYFDEKLVDAHEIQGPLSTTSSVVRGFTAFAAVSSGSLNLPGDKILGLAKFFLAVGIPGDAKDFFNQVNSLACLENSRISIPLIISLPATVLSLTNKDTLKVKVNTVLGSSAPPLTVKLVRVSSFGSKGKSIIESQELKFDAKNTVHFLDALPESIDIGKYIFVLEVILHEPEHKKMYTTGGQTQVPIFITGVTKLDDAEIVVLDSDLGSIETLKKLDLAGESLVSLAANHLQKLRISFQLTSPRGHVFEPHQAILKLKHESKVEHVFVVGNTGKKFELILDFLGLLEKFYYLSGKYDIELTVGDAVMENSFLRAIGHVDLDLPEAPEKAARPPPQLVDPYSRYGPKTEITHIFRAPEKRPSQDLSLIFLGLTLLPFVGFLLGLLRLSVNLKNFPSGVSAIFALLFHIGIAAVLLLYALFWLKLDLFMTLKALTLLGAFLMFVGHRILSHLASTSTKLKSA